MAGTITASGADPVSIPRLGGIDIPAADYSSPSSYLDLAQSGYGFGGDQQIPIENFGYSSSLQGPSITQRLAPVGFGLAGSVLGGPFGGILGNLLGRFIMGSHADAPSPAGNLWRSIFGGGSSGPSPDQLISSGPGFGGNVDIPVWGPGVPDAGMPARGDKAAWKAMSNTIGGIPIDEWRAQQYAQGLGFSGGFGGPSGGMTGRGVGGFGGFGSPMAAMFAGPGFAAGQGITGGGGFGTNFGTLGFGAFGGGGPASGAGSANFMKSF